MKDTLASLLSLKNGMELILTFLILVQLMYALRYQKRSKLFWCHLGFMALLLIHFVLLNASHYFQVILFNAYFFYILYGQVLCITFYILKKESGYAWGNFWLGGGIASGLVVFGVSLSWGLYDLPSFYLCVILLFILLQTGRGPNTLHFNWLFTFCAYFLALVSLFPITGLLFTLEEYLYFKIPYTVLFATFLMHNFSFYINRPKFFLLDTPHPASFSDQGLLQKIEHELKEKKQYRQNPFTLQDLASELGAPSYRLSKAINLAYGKTFPELVNYYRVQEVKEQLLDPKKAHLKIESLAYQAGFNTPSSFYVAFKKDTGLTPSSFRKAKI